MKNNQVELFSLTARADPGEVMGRSGAMLTVRCLPSEGDGRPLIAIEGDAQSLCFLADLLIAQALDTIDCGIQIEGERKAYFGDNTEFGLYIHKVPCTHDEQHGGSDS
jgi:hypothetical protein